MTGVASTPPAEAQRHAAPHRKSVTLLLAVLVLGGIYLLPVPAPLQRGGNLIELTSDGKTCLAIMAFAVTLWVSETLPFAATSLLIVLLIPAFGVATFNSVVAAGFGAPVIAFFIGVLIMTSGFNRSGLGTRLVYLMLSRLGTRVDRVLLGLLVAGSFISWWVTDMAVAAMLLPLGVGLLRDAGLRPESGSNVGRAVMIATAFGALIGGIATPAGTAANIVAMAQLRQLAGIEISFTQWMAYGVPAAILMVPLTWRVLLWLFPPEFESFPISDAAVRDRLTSLGPLRGVEWRTLFVFGTVIALWLASPVMGVLTAGQIDLPIEAVALAGGIALFLPGIAVLTWKEAERDVEWGGIMLIVAGLSLGLVVFETGAARWLAWVLLGGIAGVPVLVQPFVIVLAVCGLHLLFSSNTVTASIIVPILVALARDLGLDVWTVVAPAAFASSLAFILVSEGPTTIIPYSSGYFSIKDMAKAGVVVTVIAAASVAVSVLVNRMVFQ
jgi:sodium-dependent dicarboxylate transporter 2/3/5